MTNIANYKQILDCVATGIFAVDADWNITFFNNEAGKITGFTKTEALGHKCYEIFRSNLCFEGCFLKKAMEKGAKSIKGRNKILNKDNREIPVDITASVLKDDEDRIVGGVESFVDESVRVILEKKLNKSYTYHDIVGKDKQMVSLFDAISVVAPTDSHVLLLGETGSGKDLVARAIHNSSNRKKGPFIKVNCPALPNNLFESELFGYRRGAFTDAKQDKKGMFQMAEGGTIFLDEIGDLPREIQAKLHQALDENEFYPLGATESVQTDVRVITATNKNLFELVKADKFREDLYYRLKVIELNPPALRDRPSDIPLLIDHFLMKQAHITGKKPFIISPNAMKVLVNYHYPGNVRELKHIIEYSSILCQKNTIDIQDLPEHLINKRSPFSSTSKSAHSPSVSDSILKKEKEIIIEALTAHGWHRHETAKALSMDRSTLWRKMKKHGLLLQEKF